jgi:hypothetical protein
MKLSEIPIALATAIAALAGTSAFDRASAQRVTTDEAGDVSGYERVRRYNRASAERVPDTASLPATYRQQPREDGLAAVVSDSPEGLRAKRRDLARAAGAGSSQDRPAFGESTGARSRAYGIPQALPGSKMRRGGMGTPAMRGTGGMRGRR